MKVIALMPVKNEEWILDVSLESLKRYVDEIIILDDRSIDNSKKIAHKHGAIILDNIESESSSHSFSALRNRLLDVGRQRNGTHFVILDADEVVTENYIGNIRNQLSQLQRGEAMLSSWLPVWRSLYKYRDDDSVYSKSEIEFCFCDDGVSMYQDKWIHESRTPHGTKKTHRLALQEGAVLHYQFVNWYKYQMKQCWYRCVELLKVEGDLHRINRKYHFSLNGEVKVSRIEKSWLPKQNLSGEILTSVDSWHKDEILSLLEKYGAGYFEQLDIWHLVDLREEFYRQLHRLPKVSYSKSFMQTMYRVKDYLSFS